MRMKSTNRFINISKILIITAVIYLSKFISHEIKNQISNALICF